MYLEFPRRTTLFDYSRSSLAIYTATSPRASNDPPTARTTGYGECLEGDVTLSHASARVRQDRDCAIIPQCLDGRF